MASEPGSRMVEGASGGGSTSSSDGDLKAGRNEPVERAGAVRDLNRVGDVSGVQTPVAIEDGGHVSEQDGGSLDLTEESASSSSAMNRSSEGALAGASDHQQAPDDWTMVDHEKDGAVRTGELCKQMKKNTGIIVKVHEKITKVQNALHPDESEKSSKSDPGEDDERKEVQDLEASPLGVSERQGVQMFRSSSAKGACEVIAKPPEALRPTKSWRGAGGKSKSPSESIVYFSRETGVGEEASRKVSGALNETTIASEASIPSVQKEVDVSQEDPSSVPASEERSSVPLESPTSVPTSGALMVSASEAQKEVGMSPEDPSSVSVSGTKVGVTLEQRSAVSINESVKEVFTSPEAASKASASEEGSSVTSSVPASEASMIGMTQEGSGVVSTPVVQKDDHSFSEVSSTLSTFEAEAKGSVDTEATRMVSSSGVSEDAGDSPSLGQACETQEETRNNVLSPGVQNEASASSAVCEAEEVIDVVPEAASSDAQKGFHTSPEEVLTPAEGGSRESAAPEVLQRIVPEVEEKKPSNSTQQCNNTFSDVQEEGRGAGVPEGDHHLLTSTHAFAYEEQLARKEEELAHKTEIIANLRKRVYTRDIIIADLDKKAKIKEAQLNKRNGEFQALTQGYAELDRKMADLQSYNEILTIHEARMKENMTQKFTAQEKMIRDLRGQVEQIKRECGSLQDQVSLYEQQHANELSRGGSYLDDTKAATPSLLVSALNAVKDASSNFVKVLKSSITPGLDAAQLEFHIGPVSRNGHNKFQYQAYVCRILFAGFDLRSSTAVAPPTTYFRQYQSHDLKKTDTVERLLASDREIDSSLHEFCFEKFLKLMVDVQHLLTDRSVDLGQMVQAKRHPRESKLYVSFCKLSVSVWLLQRLAFSFLHPAEPFIVHQGAPFDVTRMQSVVPLDEPSPDEEVLLRVGFYVLPGFDVGNSAIPCEVYVISSTPAS